MSGMKKCTKCGKILPIEAYHHDPRAKDGRVSSCKGCVKVSQRNRNVRLKAEKAQMIVTAKRCTRCGETLPAEAFHHNPGTADGLAVYCKVCIKAYQQARREHLKVEGPQRIVTSKTCCSCKGLKSTGEFYKEPGTLDGFSPECKACQLKYHKAFRQEHPDIAHQRDSRHLKEYPDVYVNARHVRRAREAAAMGSFTIEEFRVLCKAVGERCMCCGRKSSLVADHVVPLSKGGSNDIGNIQPLCGLCNGIKGTKTIDYRMGFEAT